MSTAKGYVVRGKYKGEDVYSYGPTDGFGTGAIEISPRCIWTLDNAAHCRWFMVGRGCTDVTILAVAEDGTETPLPSYEEALAQLSRIMEGTAGIGFVGPEDRATDRVDLLLASRESISRQRDEAQAAREVERKAWARFYRAAIDHRDAAIAAEQEQPGAEEWLARTTAEEETARRALRALGVDVDDVDGASEDRCPASDAEIEATVREHEEQKARA